MAKKKRLSNDQKRKAKLVQRAKRGPQPLAYAYTGNKYKTEEFIPVFHSTETGIYETFVMTERRLTDRTVASALQKLIEQMRQGTLPPLEAPEGEHHVEGSEEDLIIWNIRRHWHDLFETTSRFSRDQLIGVLRTLLGSIDVWSSPSPQSQGYLNYIEGFLRRTGVSVQAYSPEGPLEPDDDELLELGRDWCHDGDLDAAADFRDLAEDLIHSGEADRVVNVTQQLMGESPPPPVLAELSALSLQAQRALRAERS